MSVARANLREVHAPIGRFKLRERITAGIISVDVTYARQGCAWAATVSEDELLPDESTIGMAAVRRLVCKMLGIEMQAPFDYMKWSDLGMYGRLILLTDGLALLTDGPPGAYILELGQVPWRGKLFTFRGYAKFVRGTFLSLCETVFRTVEPGLTDAYDRKMMAVPDQTP
jgi:hypothetical protein